MEKVSPKMAAAMGMGFIGFIMAAYSYNKYHTPDYVEEMQQNVENEEKDKPVKIEKKAIKQDVTEAIKTTANNLAEKIKATSGVHWGQFWKNEYDNIGNIVKTSTFLKMAPRAKPLCSRDAYRNSVQNPDLHVLISFTRTLKPYAKLQIEFPSQNVDLNLQMTPPRPKTETLLYQGYNVGDAVIR